MKTQNMTLIQSDPDIEIANTMKIEQAQFIAQQYIRLLNLRCSQKDQGVIQDTITFCVLRDLPLNSQNLLAHMAPVSISKRSILRIAPGIAKHKSSVDKLLKERSLTPRANTEIHDQFIALVDKTLENERAVTQAVFDKMDAELNEALASLEKANHLNSELSEATKEAVSHVEQDLKKAQQELEIALEEKAKAEEKLAIIKGVFSGNLPQPTQTTASADDAEITALTEKLEILESRLEAKSEAHDQDKEMITNEHAMEKSQLMTEIIRLKESLSKSRRRMQSVTKSIPVEHELFSSISQSDAQVNAENMELKSEIASLRNENKHLTKRLSR